MYDTTHRIVNKLKIARENHEKETLAAIESDTKHWLELPYEEVIKSNDELADPSKVNFLAPKHYREERSEELEETRDNASGETQTRRHENVPDVATIMATSRKEAIRVAQIVMGVIEGSRRRKRQNKRDGGARISSGGKKKNKNGEDGTKVSTCLL